MARIGVQLHTLRHLADGIDAKLDRVANAGYDGVQLRPAMGDTTVEHLETALAERDLTAAAAHIDRDRLDAAWEETLADYHTLGITDLVIPWYPDTAFADEAGIEEAARELSELGDVLAAEGYTLHYHNHAFEFTDMGSDSGFDRFADRTVGALGLEIDTGLAYHGGVDPAELIDRYAPRVSLVHLTDTIPGSSDTAHVDLLDGDVDLEACVDASLAADVDWLIYENGRTDEPTESIAAGYRVITDLLAAQG